MSPVDTLDLSDSIRRQVVGRPRISVTELARGNAWRDELVQCDIMEVVDRGSTAGWLLSEAGMAALLDTIAYFESEAESAQIAYIVESRSGYSNWKSGKDLQETIASSAVDTIAVLEAAFDGA